MHQETSTTNPTSVTVWIVTSAPFEGTTRSAEQVVNIKDKNISTLSEAVLNTYSQVGELPFSPVNFGIRKGDSVLGHGQIEDGKITCLVS